MIDSNLYGMNFIHTSAVRFRVRGAFVDDTGSCRSSTPLAEPSSPSVSVLSTSSVSSVLVQPSQRVWNVENLPNNMLTIEARVSTCELEADVLAADILNREEVEHSSGGFPGLIALWEEEQARRESVGIETPLSQPSSPDRVCSLIHSAESRHRAELERIIQARTSSLAMEDTPMSPPPLQTSLSFPFSQSCDVDVHEPVTATPVKLEERDVTTRSDHDVIVDEELVQRKSEICQKLSTATVDSTSDAELLEMLAELVGQSSSSQPVVPSSSPSHSPPIASSQMIVSQLLSFVGSSSTRNSSVSGSHIGSETRNTEERGSNRESFSPVGSDVDLFGECLVKEKRKTSAVEVDDEHRQISPSSIDVGAHYPNDTIPCNQYADGNSGLLVGNAGRGDYGGTVSASVSTDMDWLHRSNRSRTPVVQEELGAEPSQGPPSQFPMRQLSFKEKQELLRICSDLSKMEDEDNRVAVVDEPLEDTEDDDDEAESLMMSQRVWNENLDQELESDPNGEFNDIIPQLDGAGDNKKTRRLSLKSKSRRRQNRTPEKAANETTHSHQTSTRSPQLTPPINKQSAKSANHETTSIVQKTDFTDSMSNVEEKERCMKRALSGSLVPLVVKLSKEDTKTYLPPAMGVVSSTHGTETKEQTPPTHTELHRSGSLSTSPVLLGVAGTSALPLMRSTPVPKRIGYHKVKPTRKTQHGSSRLKRKASLSKSKVSPCLLSMNMYSEKELVELAIAESLRTYKMETGSECEQVEGGSMQVDDSTALEVVETLPNDTEMKEVEDEDVECDQVLMDDNASESKTYISLFESTMLNSSIHESDEEARPDSPSQKGVEVGYRQATEDEFQLVYSASETEGSESEVGRLSQDAPAPCASKVKDAIHWYGNTTTASISGDQEERTSKIENNSEDADATQTTVVPLDSLCSESTCVLTPAQAPPTAEQLMETASTLYNIPSTRHDKPFYSNPSDVQRPKEFGGTLFWIPSKMPYDLEEFSPPYMPDDGASTTNGLYHWRTVFGMCNAPIGHTQDSGPPNCHPDIRNGKSRHTFYLAADHKKDVKIRSQFVSRTPCVITPVQLPPSPQSVRAWMKERENEAVLLNKCSRTLSDSCSLLEGPSLNNTHGFKMTPETDRDMHVDPHVQYTTSMSIEIHVRTRLGLRPDPEWDPVLVVFYSIENDWEPDNDITGLIAIDMTQCKDFGSPVKSKAKSPMKKSPAKPSPKKHRQQKMKPPRLLPSSPLKNFATISLPSSASTSASSSSSSGAQTSVDSDTTRPYLDHCGLSPSLNITYVQKESDLFDELVKLVRRVDPDFLIGYEIEMSSLGYLCDRAAFLGINLVGQLARIPSVSQKRVPPTSSDVYMFGRASEVNVVGRVVLNLWRIIKHEVSLMSYSFESICFHALHKRVPKFTYQTLTEWYEQKNRLNRYRVIDYYLIRCRGNHELIDKFNLIGRTSEMARLYGIEFYSCFSRGSQYRVESMMLRLAKPANYIAVSPSVYQRAKMAAPECLPLILEPESRFYSDPVLVLDFQSLYPSMIIGYNYCFSTCLGRVQHLSQPSDYTFGACSLSISAGELESLKDDVTISPNGIVFLKPHVREGILPRMLTEILNTRIMVKQSMKLHKKNKPLLKMLDARQLSLKLIANVTYGYAGASYSGRMPCVEIADSIVRKGRETLERAIDLVHSNPKWKARVVYGDTDSLFILLKGVSKAEAFRIGNEMCQAVTRDNPKPIKLKFEKVYLPCILQTKKRYVGYSYESPDQKEPVYDAKGIETVRRDGCPAVGKILEKSLRLLFDSCDLSVVKSYLQRQCIKIMKGQVSLQDFTFGKEYRGRKGYRPGACVPALELSRQRMSVDRRSEPRAGERVPYVIVYGSPGRPLIELVRRPEDLLTDSSLRLNAVYYITKQILPALDRSFALMGVDVFQWYNELPKINRPSLSTLPMSSHKSTIGQYFASMHCVICSERTTDSVCKQCLKDPCNVTTILSTKFHKAQQKYHTISQLCANCCGYSDSNYYLECTSLDCPVLYSRQACLTQLYNEDMNESLVYRIQ